MAKRETPKGFYTLEDAASLLGISVKTLKKYRLRGTFKDHPHFNKIYLLASEVDSYATPQPEEAA